LANADDLLRDGDLDGARKALIEVVRARPEDVQARMFLFQLLALVGEWEKARTQLNALARLSPEAQMLATAYGQAIEAEHARARFFSNGGDIVIHGASGGGWAEDVARALDLSIRGETVEGIALRDRAFDAAPETPGEIDGKKFDWIADADSRFGPTLEAIIGGKWGIVAFDTIRKISSTGVRDLRDLIWYPVQIMFRSGQSVAAMLPARYPGSETSSDNQERLCRATNWLKSANGYTGAGQRELSLSSGEDVGLLALRSLSFD